MTTIRLLDFRRSASQRLSGDGRDPAKQQAIFQVRAPDPNHLYFSSGAWGSCGSASLVTRAEGTGKGTGKTEVTWGGRQHCSPIAFHTVPLPEVQGEDLTIEHRPLREGIWKVGEVAQSGHGDRCEEGALGEN